MGNGFIVIDENDWECTPPEKRDKLMYQTMKSIDLRLQKLEKRPIIDKCFSFAGGVIGGAAAALGIKAGT